MIGFLALIFVMSSQLASSDNCVPKKIIYNYVFNKQLIAMDNQLLAYDKHYINMDKMKFNLGDGIEVDGLKLYDVTQLIALDTYNWIADTNVQYAEINFGLQNMLLEINNLKYKGSEYKNAKITVENASMGVDQITDYTYNSCKQTYGNFFVKPTAKALLNGEQDITEDFNNIVISWINSQMNSKEFVKVVDSYFDNCSTESMRNLLNLITEPYSD